MQLHQKEAIEKLRNFLSEKERNKIVDKFVPGQILKIQREKIGLTAKELAQRMGFGEQKPDYRRIQRYESGKIKPQLKTLYKIFVALDIDPQLSNLLLLSFGYAPMTSEQTQRLLQIQLSAKKDNNYKIGEKELNYLKLGKVGEDEPLLYLSMKYPENGWFRIGNFIFHCARLIGGDGSTEYRWKPKGIEVEVDPTPYENLPPEINERELLEKRKKEALERGAPFENRLKVRLKRWSVGLRDVDEAPWPLRLYVQPTSFYKRAVTNASLDEFLPSGLTLRAKFAQQPDDFETSVLANILAVNLSVISTEDQKIHYAVRGKRVADHPSGYAPCVSGTANWDDKDEDVFNPFKTAKREAEEELTTELGIKYDDIVFYGLARIYHTFDPFLFGTIYFKGTSKELIDLAQTNRNSYDVKQLRACKLEPKETAREIKKLIIFAQQQAVIPHATFSAVFGLYMSLIYTYPKKKKDINETIKSLK